MSECPLKAIGNRVIVQTAETAEKSPGGIILPDNVKQVQVEAVVVSVGTGQLMPDGRHTEIEVVVGDRVIVNQKYGAEVKMGKETYLIFEHDNILAKVL